MNLSGSLGAFGLPDVFALLAMTSKSGALRVRRPSADRPQRCGVVRFADGEVVAAASDEGRQALVRRLVGAGLVEDDALAAAVDRARSDGTGIARALLESGAVEADRLRQAAREQVVDGVFELLQWSEGDFEFALDESHADDVDVRVGVDDLVSQARGREEAWADALGVVPSVDAVLTVPVRRDDDTVLAAHEWALVTMADGSRSVADLVELTGRGEFGVMTTAADLVRRGVLVVRAAGDDDHVGVVQRRLGLLAPLETSVARPAAPRPAPQPVAGMTSVPASPMTYPAEPHLGVVVPDSPAGLVDVDGASAAMRTGGAARPTPAGAPISGAPMTGGGSVGTSTIGATAVDTQRIIERDPSVNRSLLLRVIAGVKGL